jgi:uncharacterized pyridoxamine 5'-phosphate oxidase family protein
MKVRYNCDAPNISIKSESVIVEHNHHEIVHYKNKHAHKQMIQDTKIKLAGCIMFFKTVAQNSNVTDNIKAAANSAAAEDEARLAVIIKNESRCVIL